MGAEFIILRDRTGPIPKKVYIILVGLILFLVLWLFLEGGMK